MKAREVQGWECERLAVSPVAFAVVAVMAGPASDRALTGWNPSFTLPYLIQCCLAGSPHNGPGV